MKIGFLKKSELKKLFSFYCSIYPSRHVLLRREFFDWYAGKNPRIIVVQEKNKIVGQLILQPSVFNYYGRKFTFVWASNWIMRPEFRSKGLAGFFVKFLKKQRFDFFAANMVTAEVKKIMTYLGFKYKDLNRYLAVLKEDAISLARHHQVPRVKKRIKEALIKNIGPATGGIRKVNSFGADYDDFWRESFAPKTLGSSRSSKFLNWRYGREPFLKYEKFLFLDKKDEIRGVAVLRIENIRNTKLRACRVVEFFTEEKLVPGAINFMLNYAREKHCAFLDFYNLYAGFDKQFKAAGVLKNDPVLATEIPRLTQPVAHENWFVNAVFFAGTGRVKEKDFLNFKNWYTTSGDADQDRKNFL